MSSIQKFRKIRPGDQVVLTDKQTIEELMEDGAENAMDGLQLEVHRVRHVRESEGLADWYLAKLTGYKIPLILMAKVVDEEMDLRIYYRPDDIESGSRLDQINAGNSWLFNMPSEGELLSEALVPAELDMIPAFNQEVDGVGQVEFAIKGGTLHGELRTYPIPGGIPQPQFVSITEYAAAPEHYEQVENPELVVLEIGGLDEDGDPFAEGGLVRVLQGANVDPNDLSLTSL